MPLFPFGKTLKVTGSKVKSIKVHPSGKIEAVVGDSPKRNPKKKRKAATKKRRNTAKKRTTKRTKRTTRRARKSNKKRVARKRK